MCASCGPLELRAVTEIIAVVGHLRHRHVFGDIVRLPRDEFLGVNHDSRHEDV